MNQVTDSNILDILFDCKGIDLTIDEIETTLADLSRTRQSKIKTNLLVLRYHLTSIRKTVNPILSEDITDEQITNHWQERSKSIVSEAKNLIEKPIVIKSEV